MSGPELYMRKGDDSNAMGFMPQLDGLRAVACLMVMFSHFAPSGWLVRDMLPWGGLGVRLFFVLSGFLITGILLDCRECGKQGTPLTRQFRQFYARRFLRIFPLYYGLLLILWLIDYGLARESILVHLLYLQNLWRCVEGGSYANHLWSLAVEEQFYLVWPFLVLMGPRRWLPFMMLGLVPGAFIFRLALWQGDASFLYLNIFTLSNVDTLGAGAWLAWCWRNPLWRARFELAAPFMLFAGLLLLAPIMAMRLQTPGDIRTPLLFLGLAASLCFAPMVHAAARGVEGLPGRLISLRALRYLGKISYGLYVVHPFIRTWYYWAGFRDALSPVFEMAVLSLISVLAAACLWHGFERPLNDLKRHFPYAT